MSKFGAKIFAHFSDIAIFVLRYFFESPCTCSKNSSNNGHNIYISIPPLQRWQQWLQIIEDTVEPSFLSEKLMSVHAYH